MSVLRFLKWNVNDLTDFVKLMKFVGFFHLVVGRELVWLKSQRSVKTF